MMELVQGARLADRFRVVACIGTDQFGRIFLAEDQYRDDTLVALRVLSQRIVECPDLCARMKLMVSRLSRLESPYLLRPIEYIGHGDFQAMVMEYFEGITLKQKVQSGRITLDDILTILLQAGSALRALHSAGLVHGNLTLSNVLCLPGGRICLTDAGIRQVVASRMRETSELTTDYHEFQGAESAQLVDHRDDLFALGVMGVGLLQHFYGRTIDPEAGPELLRGDLPPDCPKGLQRVLLRAVDRDERNRFRNAREFLLTLSRAADKIDAPPLLPTPNFFVGAMGVYTILVGVLLFFFTG